MNKLTISVIICLTLMIGGVSAEYQTKVGLELSSLDGINWIDNTNGDSVLVTIHSGTNEVVSRYASPMTYMENSTVTMQGDKFSLNYGTDYVFNLSTDYGNFYYNFTTPDAPVNDIFTLPSSKTYIVDHVNCMGTDTVLDNATGLCWQKNDSGSTKTWSDALSYCNNLNHGVYSDWRLPTLLEADSMMDFSCTDSSLSHCFSDFQNNALDWTSGFYWAGTTYPDSTDGAYMINPFYGDMDGGNKDFSYYVRCVR